ncbi:amidohydrolase family protein [Nisaea acidiphila]|uniref:Amidohydrolase family protein n=1 Tax=Nisaea acidiphila TaxID=1862145 RepID=A0A9J7AVQ4_9PROT|nr:amidohydrolase family protein [Nisaea acidiphila]UUX50882.1 amidohydrolase family protein [Nisaea acidiphila]
MDQKSSFHPNPSAPRLKLPAGATDCHCHVFGPEASFPYAEDRTYTPAGEAPKEKLFAMHDAMGLQRCVIVQAGCHGFDNSVVADAIAARPGRYLGIALLPTDIPLETMRALDAKGFRGVRFNFMRHLGKGASLTDVIAMTERLVEVGWHLQVHMEKELLEEMSPELKRSHVPVVIDHMARVDAALGIEQPAFTALRRILEAPGFWVKVSGSERASRDGPPYADGVPFARSLVAEFGDKVLWGTDWPHPNLAGPVPDDGMLVDLIGEIAPGEAARQALLVDNPARLYGFS